MTQTDLATYNVIGAFRDTEVASDALGALREAGFTDDELSILGRSPEEFEGHTEWETGEPIGGDVGKHIATGATTGGAAGGVLGALGAVAVAAIPGVGLVAGTGALIGAISGGGLGATVGAIVEGESAMRTSHGWEQTFDAIKEGAVVVGVHSEDPDRVSEAAGVLEDLAPMSVRRVNDRGQEVATTDDAASSSS